MADLIAVAFKDSARAFDMRAELLRMQSEYLIDMEDVAVATRDTDGKVKLHQATNLTALGAISGSFWGLLLGAIFLSPLFGAAVGAGFGALSGKLSDIGINDDFMRRLSEGLPNGGSSIFVLVRKVTPDRVKERLEPFRGEGTILQTSLTVDQEDALREVLQPETTN